MKRFSFVCKGVFKSPEPLVQVRCSLSLSVRVSVIIIIIIIIIIQYYHHAMTCSRSR
ncbi:hypothetical protein BDV28DRAFT_16634 [Aspergillus coremiiformis]|uniref:Uncharacterized protein n=1 Tax=Aspergillus coremiiformis TaxID=138285 RepID=A0A5N6ZIB9_9EURO|nr:hypothetical protein BDV28DRAFT_16634 [Aspergillus coremiiformis]